MDSDLFKFLTLFISHTMRSSLGLLGLAALAAASDVHDLTKDTFPDFVKTHDLVLAECTFRPI